MHVLVVAVSAAIALAARPPVSAGLPPVVHADVETTTNIPFAAALDVAGRFSFTLSCRATPSNNVEVAFGTDANANGVLDLEEIDRVVGWDCGAWFTCRKADGAHVSADVESTNDVRTFTWNLKTGQGGRPTKLTVRSEGTSLFEDLPLESVYDRSWNMLRLTGRGLNASLEKFTVSVTPDGTSILMR